MTDTPFPQKIKTPDTANAERVLIARVYGALGDDNDSWHAKSARMRFMDIVAEHGGKFEFWIRPRQSRQNEKAYGPLYELRARFRNSIPEQIYKQLSEAGFSSACEER
jgi:hypothetical protein